MKRLAAMTAALVLIAAPVHGQMRFEVEAGGGYTVVDVSSVAFNDGATATDWNQPNYRLAARFMAPGSGLRFGAEVSYQSLYWYSVRIPFGSNPIRREYDVTATSALGLLRMGSDGRSFDIGAGVAFLDDPVAALSLAVGIEVIENLSLKLRADGLLATDPTIPVGVGFSYAFGRN